MASVRYIFAAVAVLCCLTVHAQKPAKFNPAKFEAELEQFVAIEAALTPKEAAAFFPLYREMRRKQFAFFGEDRRLCNVDTDDDKACAEAIHRRDDNDLEIKRLQQAYHDKFMRVLSPSKVFRVIRAEDKFHRRLFNRQSGKQVQKKENKHHGK